MKRSADTKKIQSTEHIAVRARLHTVAIARCTVAIAFPFRNRTFEFLVRIDP